MISVIIPTFNEMNNGYLKNILESLKDIDEVIVADSNSTDGTLELAKSYTDKVYTCDVNSRSERINLGVLKVKNEIILLHHPRSILEPSALDELAKISSDIKWGAFTHKFDRKHYLLKFASWYSNTQRGDKDKIYYLDHCIFIRKEVANRIFPIPTMDIFEDTEISIRLKEYKSKRLTSISTTSAIRFNKNGVLRQCLMNLYLKHKYKRNTDHKQMNSLYEKNTKLNNNYDNNRD